MSDIDFSTGDWLPLSKALKGVEPQMRRELHAGLRKGAAPIIPLGRDAIRDAYPKRGGLAGVIAEAKAKVVVHTGGAPGVSIVFKGITVKLGEVYGSFRHPVHGRPDRERSEWSWVPQQFDMGRDLLYTVTRRNVRLITPELAKAVQRVVDQVVSRSG